MNKKLFALFSVLLIAAFALSACGPKPTPVSTTPVEITLWHAYGTGSAEETALTKVLAQAATDMPDIKINVLQVPFNDIFNKYRTDVAAGAGPDLFVAPNDSLGDDARNGLSQRKDKLATDSTGIPR